MNQDDPTHNAISAAAHAFRRPPLPPAPSWMPILRSAGLGRHGLNEFLGTGAAGMIILCLSGITANELQRLLTEFATHLTLPPTIIVSISVLTAAIGATFHGGPASYAIRRWFAKPLLELMIHTMSLAAGANLYLVAVNISAAVRYLSVPFGEQPYEHLLHFVLYTAIQYSLRPIAFYTSGDGDDDLRQIGIHNRAIAIVGAGIAAIFFSVALVDGNLPVDTMSMEHAGTHDDAVKFQSF